MRIIPAIDIIDGKCVRLEQGDYSRKKVYNEDPLEVAKQFEDIGVRYLHLVDLDAAKGSGRNLDVLNTICDQTDLQVDFGGGIKTTNNVYEILDAGAAQITAGSVALKDRELVSNWLEIFGEDKIILGADVLNGYIASAAWTKVSDVYISDFLNDYRVDENNYIVCTSITQDGMLKGPDWDLYKEIMKGFDCKLIASGGVSSVEDLDLLTEMNVDGAIVGKAIYENRITLIDLKKYVDEENYSVS